MELNKAEVAMIEQAVGEAQELSELQLALVGGGIGNAIVG